MKFSKNVAKVVLAAAAAVATAIVAGGCEQKSEPAKSAPAPTKAPEPKK